MKSGNPVVVHSKTKSYLTVPDTLTGLSLQLSGFASADRHTPGGPVWAMTMESAGETETRPTTVNKAARIFNDFIIQYPLDTLR